MIQFAIGGSIKVVTIDYRQFDISIAGENEILRMIEFDVCEVELRLIYRYFNILEMIELAILLSINIDILERIQFTIGRRGISRKIIIVDIYCKLKF